mgnify:CR=1
MNNKIPKYVVVENKIKESLKYRYVDEKLPGERVLAKEFGVSYMTLRKAVDNLVAEGYLYRVATQGTYVSHYGAIRSMARNIARFSEHSTISEVA